MKIPDLVLVNGYGKFFLAEVAAELARRGHALQLVTGVQFPPALRCLEPFISRSAAGRRLLQRQHSADGLTTRIAWWGEPAYHLGRLLGDSRFGSKFSPQLHAGSMAAFGRQVRRQVTVPPGGLFHFRAGYGDREHLAELRARGVTLVCDHSIAHPRALVALLETGGRLPPTPPCSSLDAMNARIERDLMLADAVVVNSEFVKQTCVWAGMEPDRVHVVYAGVETDILQVLDGLPPRPTAPQGAQLRVLCAGRMEARKGAQVVARAVRQLPTDSVEVTLVGTWDPRLSYLREELSGRPGLTLVDHMDRLELARFMREFDVFLFPSLAEGSARVVAMAMAAGCSVVVTPNSGSFFRPGTDGLSVPPGDPDAIVRVLLELAADRERAVVAGQSGADLVRRCYRYEDYASRLMRTYTDILKAVAQR